MGKKAEKDNYKTFKQAMSEIRESTYNAKTGKRIKSHSRSQLEDLAVAFANTPKYVADVAKVKDGKIVKEEVYPVMGLRSFLGNIATKKFGVEANEAKNISETMMFENGDMSWFHPFSSELIYQYMKAGKKFDFLTKEDFKGGICSEEKAETIEEYTAPSTKQKGKIKKLAHTKLISKSKAPHWKKEKVK